KQKLQLEGIQSVQQLAEKSKLLRSKVLSGDLENVDKGSYFCSSLCGFPYRKLDFGWGKPMGTTLATRSTGKNGFVLMDTPDGDGIEALVMLEEQHMKIFENDKEMLSFCRKGGGLVSPKPVLLEKKTQSPYLKHYVDLAYCINIPMKLLRLGRRRQLHTIISRDTIRPSSRTPSHLQTYNLSELDQLNPKAYIPFLLFYPNNPEYCKLTTHQKSILLKKSLSHSLTQHYPLAGRLLTPTTPSYIDCNDEGVVFVEACNDSQLEAFQHMTGQDDALSQLFADGVVHHMPPSVTNVVRVQVNHFSCGGLGIAMSMSHLVGDACSLGSFLSHWASVARFGSSDHSHVVPLNPHFIRYPRVDFVGLINNPTRVEVLTSLLYKTAVTAASIKYNGFKPSYLFFMGSYFCSSLCGFPYRKLDFGWGKPTGTTLATRSTGKNGFVLMDTPDGDGIEALVMLEEQHMKIFENDKEMLLFCRSDAV
ncbi:hypothetical protein M8C21_015201, partial [Ambrosia artemisiifolia]